MTTSSAPKSDPKAELSYTEAVKIQRVDFDDGPVEPKYDVEEAPGLLSPQSEQ
ncbi:hypothetical protein [Arthrobacter oryzae]|uniref:hypothetical protein n=1 Tax=Arthrobacter oryzae TaxID=409290 RepID=UPI001605B7FE|nr:hypothetical protein [Arthrobacter oryzae]